MKIGYIAVMSAIFLWGLTYLISLILILSRFSCILKLKTIVNKGIFYKILFLITFILPLLAATVYRIGGFLQGNRLIYWGCFIEDFYKTFFIWKLVSLIMFFLMIITLVKPSFFGFKKRLDIIFSYILLQSYNFIMIIIYLLFIYYTSGYLSGKSWNCY